MRAQLASAAMEFITPILAALAAVILGFVGKEVVVVLKWISAKLGVQVSAATEAAVAVDAQRLVLAAAEWGARELKTSRAVVSGEAKFAKVADALVKKYPALTSPAVTVAVDSAVAQLGLGAAGQAVADKISKYSPPPLPPTGTSPGKGA